MRKVLYFYHLDPSISRSYNDDDDDDIDLNFIYSLYKTGSKSVDCDKAPRIPKHTEKTYG